MKKLLLLLLLAMVAKPAYATVYEGQFSYTVTALLQDTHYMNNYIPLTDLVGDTFGGYFTYESNTVDADIAFGHDSGELLSFSVFIPEPFAYQPGGETYTRANQYDAGDGPNIIVTNGTVSAIQWGADHGGIAINFHMTGITMIDDNHKLESTIVFTDPQSVPEPATCLLIFAIAFVLLLLRRLIKNPVPVAV